MKKFNSIYLIGLCLILLTGGRIQAAGSKHRSNHWYAPSSQSYQALWQSIKSSRTEHKPIRVVHLGDSHITSGFTTAPIREQLSRQYGDSVQVQYWGINGATYVTYSIQAEIDRIVKAKPDLLIVSLGTNDSYTFRFSAEEFRANMATFFTLLEKSLPDLPIVLTTPPPSFLKKASRVASTTTRKRGKRRQTYRTVTNYSYNKNTNTAARTMDYLARQRGYALINLYASIGSEREAKHWLAKGWMHTDRTHYTVPGYTKHGEYIAGALVEMIEQKSKPASGHK
ncbi:MAG: GDSL-type esterase/lipase family protein [Porphyromonadaceae bacterium]|nr:GDSL-type esterase/lipase family protein [Porphyromonadaceae bacterium]